MASRLSQQAAGSRSGHYVASFLTLRHASPVALRLNITDVIPPCRTPPRSRSPPILTQKFFAAEFENHGIFAAEIGNHGAQGATHWLVVGCQVHSLGQVAAMPPVTIADA